ncbi:hypothetical protein [Nostoc sp.]
MHKVQRNYYAKYDRRAAMSTTGYAYTAAKDTIQFNSMQSY